MTDGYACPICGKWVMKESGHSHPQYLEPIKCEHCYCLPGKGWGGTNVHMKCCKCGDETMTSTPITY